VSLRKQSVSVGAALAFWLGNPVLNPATIIFMGFVLSWKFAILRIFFGILLVLGVATLANRFVNDEDVSQEVLSLPDQMQNEPQENLIRRFIKSVVALFINVVPIYLVTVLLLGAARAWLFPAVDPSWGNSILALIGLAIAGTLFVIPTAAEIPIVKTMMSYGLGTGSAVALVMTLPAVSLPSLLMVRKVFPAKALWMLVGVVISIGILGGLAAMIFI
jgi:uncharacterized protein